VKRRSLRRSGNFSSDLIKGGISLSSISEGENEEGGGKSGDSGGLSPQERRLLKHPRHPANISYRKQVLRSLLLKNEKLNYIDNRYISLIERIYVFAKETDKKRQAEVDKYRFRVGLAANSCLPLQRRLHPTCLLAPEKGKNKYNNYSSSQITSLRRMDSLMLKTNVGCSFLSLFFFFSSFFLFFFFLYFVLLFVFFYHHSLLPLPLLLVFCFLASFFSRFVAVYLTSTCWFLVSLFRSFFCFFVSCSPSLSVPLPHFFLFSLSPFLFLSPSS